MTGTATNCDLVLDQVVVDLSPLRLSKANLEYVATKILEQGYDEHKGGGRILGANDRGTDDNQNVLVAPDETLVESPETQTDQVDEYDDDDDDEEEDEMQERDVTSGEAVAPRMTRPIYQLASYCVQWELPRSDAKALAKKLATVFGTCESKAGTDTAIGSQKPKGVKPGKSRRSGGYGIG